MIKNFNGKALFLDRSDINTDEIIPGPYLTEISKEAIRPHLLEGLILDGFTSGVDTEGRSVIVTRANFGFGSSREHASWALEVNGINLIIAESFARIFKQNTFNCGMLAVELPAEVIDSIFAAFSDKETVVETNLEKTVFSFKSGNQFEQVTFSISDFNRTLVETGGWVQYATMKYGEAHHK